VKELVFSTREIFESDNPSGCLFQYDAKFFHIPAYQRGFKWGTGKTGAVTLLLEDLWDAFKQDKPEYYLQYITVKPISLADMGSGLEVIDGQQRLATLSILLSVFAASLDDAVENVADRKLHYAIRENLFYQYIYPKEALLEFCDLNWEDLIEKDAEKFNRQDVYYLHGAAQECSKFIDNDINQINEFYNYVLASVKIIVNSIEPHIQSETVFKNLNSNKVLLSETELIKALLITRAGREKVSQSEAHFLEVMEVRVGLGRLWDDMQHWSNTESIKSFYFENHSDAMHQLLKLTTLSMGASLASVNSGDGEKILFSFFNKQDTRKAIDKLLEIQRRLVDWFDQDEIYHLIGFCRFVKGSKKNNLNFINECLKKQTLSELKKWLISEKSLLINGRNNSLNKEEFGALRYGENSNQIHAILLALSVFPPEGITSRFDFEAFERENWSLEHIFPQTPEGKGNLLSDADKANIKSLLRESGLEITDEIETSLALPIRSDEQKHFITEQLSGCIHVHSIGNMCLLTGGDNSVLGCGMFDKKREAILRLIQKGSFVPKHTFDVFAKMITGLDKDLARWSLDDIQAHEKNITGLLCSIRTAE